MEETKEDLVGPSRIGNESDLVGREAKERQSSIPTREMETAQFDVDETVLTLPLKP